MLKPMLKLKKKKTTAETKVETKVETKNGRPPAPAPVYVEINAGKKTTGETKALAEAEIKAETKKAEIKTTTKVDLTNQKRMAFLEQKKSELTKKLTEKAQAKKEEMKDATKNIALVEKEKSAVKKLSKTESFDTEPTVLIELESTSQLLLAPELQFSPRALFEKKIKQLNQVRSKIMD